MTEKGKPEKVNWKGEPVISVCAFCGEKIRRHLYKGWYHQDGKGKGHRDHRPKPEDINL